MGRNCRQCTSILSIDDIPISIWILFWYVIIIICMKKRIEELALQCGAWHQVYDHKRLMVDRHFDVEKFAGLIVRECLAQVDKVDEACEDDVEKLGISWVGYAIEKHFGVG